jgi:hypothetical protein
MKRKKKSLGSAQAVETVRIAKGKTLDFPSTGLDFRSSSAWIFLPRAWIFLRLVWETSCPARIGRDLRRLAAPSCQTLDRRRLNGLVTLANRFVCDGGKAAYHVSASRRYA